jgi:predicted enzyme related to lactoylglutathione lyase
VALVHCALGRWIAKPDLNERPQRIPLDDSPAALDAEAERLVALGATRVRQVMDESGTFVIMQDPEGNEFCVG